MENENLELIEQHLKKYFCYLSRVQLVKNEKLRLLTLFLPPMSLKEENEVRKNIETVLRMNRQTLSDEIFRIEQYELDTGVFYSVLKARNAVVSAKDASDNDPDVETTRGKLFAPTTLGEKYDRALLDYARENTADSVNALIDLVKNNYCLDAAENLINYFSTYGIYENNAKSIYSIYKAIWENCLFLNMPEWCGKFEEKLGKCDPYEIKSYKPYNPQKRIEDHTMGFN